MTVLTPKQEAWLETTKRLVAGLINEGLVKATVTESRSEETRHVVLTPLSAQNDNSDEFVAVKLHPGIDIEVRNRKVIPTIQPRSICAPIVLRGKYGPREELEPGKIFLFIMPWLVDEASESVLIEIGQHLQASGRNQEMWLRVHAEQGRLDLEDPPISWERSLVYGHPTHPFHRTCHPQAPLEPVKPEDIPVMMTPDITFISVARTELTFSGPFDELLKPLLLTLDILEVAEQQAVVPCLTKQLPSILRRFPNAIILKTVSHVVDAQASLRTLTVRPDMKFPFHLKLSLACQITSALRTITPWSAMGGPHISKILDKLLPPGLWFFKEVASVTGSQTNFDDAKHLSCILREDLQTKAEKANEALIIASALTQRPYGESQSYAEILFNLKSVHQKKEWFRLYVNKLLGVFLHPLMNHGIGMEAHGQNVAVRVCRATGQIQGFAIRDFGGIRLHTPTLRRQGVEFDEIAPGWTVLTESMREVFGKVHHSLVQNHVGFLLNSLCLERNDGWTVVRDVLETTLRTFDSSSSHEIHRWFVNDTIALKCFLRMRMQGKYRDYVEREVPNILLQGTDRWESIISNYVPVLHCA